MSGLRLVENCLGFEVCDQGRLIALYRAREELPRMESPKPCFAPIFTPSGMLVTEYKPVDHVWHTGLYFGWVHVNEANLWGGPWYVPEKGQYEYVEHSHGVQRHDEFLRAAARSDVRQHVTRRCDHDVLADFHAGFVTGLRAVQHETAVGCDRAALEHRQLADRIVAALDLELGKDFPKGEGR